MKQIPSFQTAARVLQGLKITAYVIKTYEAKIAIELYVWLPESQSDPPVVKHLYTLNQCKPYQTTWDFTYWILKIDDIVYKNKITVTVARE